jgi:hypothetical protein
MRRRIHVAGDDDDDYDDDDDDDDDILKMKLYYAMKGKKINSDSFKLLLNPRITSLITTFN